MSFNLIRPQKSNCFPPVEFNKTKVLIPLHVNISFTKQDVCFPRGCRVALSRRRSILDGTEGRKEIKGESSSSWRPRMLLTDAATCFLACRLFVGNCLAMWRICLSAFLVQDTHTQQQQQDLHRECVHVPLQLNVDVLQLCLLGFQRMTDAFSRPNVILSNDFLQF